MDVILVLTQVRVRPVGVGLRVSFYTKDREEDHRSNSQSQISLFFYLK